MCKRYMKRILGYFWQEKIDLLMFCLIPTLFIWYLIDKDILKLYAAIGFAWFWMAFAIIRMGMFRELIIKLKEE